MGCLSRKKSQGFLHFNLTSFMCLLVISKWITFEPAHGLALGLAEQRGGRFERQRLIGRTDLDDDRRRRRDADQFEPRAAHQTAGLVDGAAPQRAGVFAAHAADRQRPVGQHRPARRAAAADERKSDAVGHRHDFVSPQKQSGTSADASHHFTLDCFR